MTIRSEGQFNTVVYEDYDLYRGVERRDVILIHPDDIQRLGLDISMTVAVHGPAGTLRNVRLHPFNEIRPGNAAMYYPEANVLVSRHLDPKSKTPAFKCVVVTVETQEAAWSNEIRRRTGEIDSGKVKTIPWSEARKKIVGNTEGD